MKNKFILLLTALCCSTILCANGVKIGDIYYILDQEKLAAAVTYKGKPQNSANANTYQGDVVLPEKVTYRGREYVVTTIGAMAFANCKITSIHIPSSIRAIRYNAFYITPSLNNVYITDLQAWCNIDMERSGSYRDDFAFTNPLCGAEHLFLNEEEIQDLVIPSSVKIVKNGVFFGYKGLRSLTIPDDTEIETIGIAAFESCKNLQSIYFGKGLKKIDDHAFEHCSLIDASVTIPKSVIYIGGCAFSGCGIGEIRIDGKIDNIRYNTFASCGRLKKVELPNSLIYISSEAFYNCRALRYIDIPNTVERLDERAFYNCEKITSVTLPSNIKFNEYYTGKDAFKGCKNLQALYYPEGADISKLGLSLDICFAYKPKPATQQPPLLAVVQGSLVFSDDNKNNMINADEQCKIRFKISNNGKGAGEDCVARISQFGNNKGISVKDVKLPSIPAGKTVEVTIPITTDLNTQNGKVTFSIEVYEPNGFGVAPFDLTVATKAYEPPYLQVVDYNIASNSGKIKKMEPFTLTFNLQNTKYGTADDIIVKLNLPAGIFVMDDNTERRFTQIKSGEVKQVSYTLIANNNYATSTIPITIDVKEKHGKFAENRKLDIALNQTTNSTIQIAAKEEPQQERKEIQLAMMKSEVDRNIPVSNTKNPNTFVLIIANEHYSQVASVPFALNDGNIFREYCIKTLGIGEKHIKYLSDATGNQIKSGVNWLANLTEAFDEPQIIVYYAGHGIPDEANKSAYLLPVDGSGTDVTTGYKLDNLYTTLGKMPASQITVFMDACFSGSKRENGMIASARGVALRVKSGVPQGNMVVFSAAQGDETAYPNREQQHGLFTYYLLKKLQETQGDIALKDLGDYITKQVSQQSLLLNSKKQTPCVTPSVTLGDQWQNWKLK